MREVWAVFQGPLCMRPRSLAGYPRYHAAAGPERAAGEAMRILWIGLAGLALCWPIGAGAGAAKLQTLADGEHRSEAHRDRNAFRHPVETLEFFGLRSDMTVIEIWPGGGWYTEILAPYLRERGRYYAAGFDRQSPNEYFQRGNQRFAEKLGARSELYDHAVVTALSESAAEIAPAGSADLVLTFRSLHGWMRAGWAQAAMDASFRALKPGGVLGLVQHRAEPGTEQDPKAERGYVTEAHAIALAEAAGFVLEARSEINANPRDTHDHPGGVWTLPPTLRLGEENRAAYQAIGESDRMTLKFRKPASAGP